VITDEIYSELTFEGEHVSIAALPGMRRADHLPPRLLQGLRHDRIPHRLCLRPRELIEAMMRIHQYSMLCASIISQEAALEAIEHGEPDTLEMREHYRLRRNYIVNAFNNGPDLSSAARLVLRLSLHPITGLDLKEFACSFCNRKSGLRALAARLAPAARVISAAVSPPRSIRSRWPSNGWPDLWPAPVRKQ
jgi:aminotransferase